MAGRRKSKDGGAKEQRPGLETKGTTTLWIQRHMQVRKKIYGRIGDRCYSSISTKFLGIRVCMDRTYNPRPPAFEMVLQSGRSTTELYALLDVK